MNFIAVVIVAPSFKRYTKRKFIYRPMLAIRGESLAVKIGKVGIILIIAGLLCIVGVVSPWSVNPALDVSSRGTSYVGGWLALVGGVMALVGGLVSKRVITLPYSIVGGVCAIIGGGWGYLGLGEGISAGWGIFVTLLAGVLCFVGTALARKEL
jgi:hypothetical protein